VGGQEQAQAQQTDQDRAEQSDFQVTGKRCAGEKDNEVTAEPDTVLSGVSVPDEVLGQGHAEEE
jgi:hypothetical protein